MKNILKSEFIKYYQEIVRPIAVKCADGFKTMADIENGKKVEDTDEGMIKIKAAVDANAIWYVGLMIGDVDKAVMFGSDLNLINSLYQVKDCLNSDSYWTNVWKDDSSSEEAKNLKELAELMKELMSKF